MLGIEADSLFKKRIAHGPVEYFIYIFFFYTGTDGVKILRRLAGVQNGNILRQAGIERKGQSLHGYAGPAVKIRAVAQGVDACVRASASDDAQPLPADPEDGILYGLGYGDVIFLHLPSMVAAAVIAQAEGNIFHSPNLLSAIISARKANPRARAI